MAVFGFKNLSGKPDEAWLSTAFSEMLTTELAAGEQLRTIPGENVWRVRTELSLPEADSFSRDTLARIRRNLGCDYVVLGSYLALGEQAGGQVRMDVRLQDAAAGETLASVSETGTEAGLLDLVARTGAQLREKLGAGGVPATAASGARAAISTNPEAARLYSEGLAELRLFNALAGRDLLQRAVASDPSYPLAHSALAAAWSALGYDPRAKEEAKRAYDLSTNLSREDRLSIEGRYREMNREWEKAVEIYRTLWDFFPDSLDYGLRLAKAQVSSGRGKEAMATVEALRKLPPPASEDSRIDLAEASAADSLADYRRKQAAAERAGAKAAAQGAQLLLAQARMYQGSALLRFGQPEGATAAYKEAQRIFAVLGDRGGVGRSLNNVANAQRENGQLIEAKKTYGEALAVFRQLGDQRDVAIALNNIAITAADQDDLAEATRLYRESLAAAREVGDKGGVSLTLNNLAVVLWQQGDLAGAKRMLDEALAIARDLGNKHLISLFSESLADVLVDQGDLMKARKVYQEALAVNRQIGDQRYVAFALFGLGDLLVIEGDLAGARKSHEEALAIREKVGDKVGRAESRLALAKLSMEEGHFEDAQAIARDAAEGFRSQKAVLSDASAEAVLARSLLTQGKLTEAQESINRATALSARSQNQRVRLSVAITAARIRAASSEPDEAVRSLEAILGQAMKA